jgi:hypothetical protein
MIYRILRQAQDEENHQAWGGANHIRSGLILSLSKDADALTQMSPKARIQSMPAFSGFPPSPE